MRRLAALALVGFVGIASAQSNNNSAPQTATCAQATDTKSISGSEITPFAASSDAWRETVGTLVKEPLWSDRDAYDAAHALMAPLHYAFAANDHTGILDFETLMGRFAMQELTGGQLQMAQWMYFVSRYLSLRAEFSHPLREIDKTLARRVAAWLYVRWEYEPGFSWGRPPFIGSKARLAYVRNSSTRWPLSYYPAVTDYELFLFAIASDLKYLQSKYSDLPEQSGESIALGIDEIVSTGIAVIRERGTFTDNGGWIFQKGIWSDHPDFRFAGHTQLAPNLPESRLPEISEDSSHAHRWPLFLRSMIAATPPNSDEKKYLLRFYSGFSDQFAKKVVKRDKEGILLTNYTNGHNGIYRYRYSTIGANEQLGYGPYALSGILGESWYPFAHNVEDIFESYANSYPLTSKILTMYVGPNTTRARNPLFAWPDFFTNGFAELIAKQGSYLSRHYKVRQATLCN